MTEAAAPVLDPMTPRPFRVISTRQETADTISLELVAATEDGTFKFEPGQFTMMYVYGVGEVPISISGDPATPRVLGHTVRRVGAVTNAICDLDEDAQIGIRGPFGAGWPLSAAAGRDILVVAGGIGLAPLRPAVLDLLAKRELYGSLSLLYGTRSPEDILFSDDIHAWRARFDMEADVTVDRPSPGWRGDVGLVTTLLPRVAFDPAKTSAFVCGPDVMMRVVARDLTGLGVPASEIYLNLERNMKCAVGFCGHCQFGQDFICRDGPVMSYERVVARLGVREI